MDYDLPTLMRGLGINPDTVAKGTVKIDFRDDYPVLTYTAILGVPAKVLGAALLAAAADDEPQTEPEDDQPAFDELVQDAEARQTHADGYPMEEMGQ